MLSLDVFAQPNTCGFVDPPSTNPPSPPENEVKCFDQAQVLQNCTPVHVRINFHFFVPLNGVGSVQVFNVSQEEAYDLAQSMIEDANTNAANNQNNLQWGISNPTAICCPIRFVLAGVYFHKVNTVINGINVSTLQNQYGVNINTEINMYAADYPGPATGIGYTNLAAGSMENNVASNFYHEVGHVLGLYHTFSNDGCSDTPIIKSSWDTNCDGIDDQFNINCWTIETYQNSDINNNGISDCNEMVNNNSCNDHTCCSWNAYDNNIMGYGGYKYVMTPCQIKTMLGQLSSESQKCDYVASIGSCPPPMAFISQPPVALQSTACFNCLYLGASDNEDAYLLKIYEVKPNGFEMLKWSSGWKSGTADKFCYSTNGSTVDNQLASGTTYRASLTVRNICDDEASSDYIFTTLANCTYTPGEPGTTTMSISPNPGTNEINITYTGRLNEAVNIYAYHQITGQQSLIQQYSTPSDGTNTIQTNISGLNAGQYTIVLSSQFQIQYKQFIKL